MIRRFAPDVRGLLALAALLIGVPAFAQSAAIASTTPSTLNQANLRTAVIAVNLTGATYESSADTSHFTLNTTISGLSVNRLWFNSGRDGALLYLQWDGSDFDAAATISVTVAAAATNHNAALTTSTVAVGPARWVNVSTETVALAEGGGAGTYTVVLESTPTGNVTLTVTSDNAAVTVDSDATPLTRTLTFTTMNWATAQTVTVTPVDDNSDTVDEVALVTNVATGGGYSSSTTADRTVRVTVADDDARTGTDYDADDDQLIEIDSLAKLNAVRWDLNGDGTASSGNATTYAAAFPGAAAGMGCPDSGDADALGNCAGYELTADLDFDTNRDGTVDASDAYPNWAPIGGDYNATFHGNNRTISNLTTTGGGERGLFWGLGGSSRVSNLGLVDVSVTATSGPGANYRGVGALAGQSDGTIEAVYVRGGTVSASSGGGRGVVVGGLVGYLFEGVIRACYSTAAVSASSVLSPDVGGLVGHASAPIVASYAAGTVHVHVRGGTGNVGGLVGWATTNYSVFTNSYATGRVSWDGSALRGGLLARRNQSGSAPGSTWDWQTTGQGGGGGTTSDLQTPTGYTGIYGYWDDYDTDGDGRIDADDDAWDFGLANQYPSLKWRGLDPAEQFAATPVDYDDDNDNLVDIRNLAQLDAMRHDLDGNGAPTAGGHGAYFAAFPNAVAGMGCAATCAGYELRNDLDFDTSGDGDVDADDDYPNWTPIPVYSPNLAAPSFQTTFRGNGHVIDKLTVRRPTTPPGNTVTRGAGLFGIIGAGGRIESLGVVDASVEAAGGDHAGIITAELRGGRIVACYSTGSVSAVDYVGGLVGRTYSQGAKDRARIVASYSTATVSADSRGWQPGAGNAAGLVGRHLNGVILASYAAGPVSSQADPRYSGTPGGQGLSSGVFTLVSHFVGAVRDSYWDTEATGQTTTYATSQAGDGGDPGTGVATMDGGQTTAALKSPTGYTGIYASWNIDLDGDDAPDDPWDFGASSEYPSLKWGGHDPARQFALLPDEPQEASSVPTDVRTQTTAQGLVVTWRAAAGATSYLVQWRLSGEAWSSQRQAETTETRYEIAGLPAGAYEVRVLPVVDGEVGEPSAPARGESGVSNRPPLARGIADMALDVGGTAEVDLEATFSDPDGDALRYAASADDDAVEAWVSGGTLRLRAMRPGEATVAVTATDPDGLSASATFTVRVGAMLSLRGNPSAPEGGEAAFQAELNRALGTDVEVRWSLAADGDPTTADADEADFAAWSGTATIAAGETRARIVVEVLDDDAIEPARERFAVALEEPENPNVGLSVRAQRALGSVQEGVCDRTPEVRAELSRGWRACHWPGPADLARLSRFDLRGAGAESLRADDLLGLSGLRTLDIGSNALRELPAALLSHSPRLRSLRLDGNRLQSLPAGLFAGVSGLRALRLSGNPGAPFALALELRRADAAPWAAGPATVEAHLPLGAPFAMQPALTVVGGEASAEELTLAAGTIASGAASISGDGPVRVMLAAPTIPDERCGDAPCFDGLAAQGATLALFATPPSVASDVAPADLLGAGDARIDLSAHFAAGGGGALTYSATVDAPHLASVSVDGAILLVSANEDGEEGTATVTVVATDEFGQTATLRFAVEVSPRPPGNWRGWRTTLTHSAVGQ